MRVPVLGGTGSVGTPVVDEALSRGHNVVALVRDRARGISLHPASVALVEGDVSTGAGLKVAADGPHRHRTVPAVNQPAPTQTNERHHVMKQTVTFTRDDLTLVGTLFIPDGAQDGDHFPAIIVQGSFTSVKEQMPTTYAGKFVDQGFVVLAFDYAHYGQSSGAPRQLESTEEKLADLQAALTYLTDQPFVDAVGMVGVCTSASNGAYLAATDPRLKAFATIAGMVAKPDMYPAMMGEDVIARRLSDAQAAREKFASTGEGTRITTYSQTDDTAANYNPTPGAYDYYTNPERGGVPEYTNEFDVSSWDSWLTLDPLSQAPSINTPTMVVHSDGCAFPDNAKELYAAVQGPKELVWADGTHFDYYDSDAQVSTAVQNVTRFFRTHLS